jgi:DNA invertase Pin-like site-specific DNA recombinase
MTTVLYCRVSTVDQTVDHQLTQAHQNGFKPDLVLADHGISGVSVNRLPNLTPDRRPILTPSGDVFWR